MKYKSEVVDSAILTAEDRLRREHKNLIKSETVLSMVENHIDLYDDEDARQELMFIGIKQVIQSRLYAHGYFSIGGGFFVNVYTCQKIEYLKDVVKNKENVLEIKSIAKKRIEELMKAAGQSVLIPDENNNLILTETKLQDEVIADLEADAV